MVTGVAGTGKTLVALHVANKTLVALQVANKLIRSLEATFEPGKGPHLIVTAELMNNFSSNI